MVKTLKREFDDWQRSGWIPNWRIEPGEKTEEPIRTRGWTHWHHLFTPRRLLMNGYYSQRIAERDPELRAVLQAAFGRLLNHSARLCVWLPSQGGGIGGGKNVFLNQPRRPPKFLHLWPLQIPPPNRVATS